MRSLEQAIAGLCELPGLKPRAAQQSFAEIGPQATALLHPRNLCLGWGCAPGERGAVPQ